MRRAFCCFILCMIAALPSIAATRHSSPPESVPAQRILFKGSKRYQDKQLLAMAGLKSGSTYTEQEVEKSANRLSGIGVFSQVAYRSTSAWIEFDLKDNERLVPLHFQNIVWLSDEELMAGLKQRLPAFLGAVPDSGTLSDDIAHQIEAMLADKGIKASVQDQPIAKAPGQPITAFDYSVMEPQLAIGEFVFDGAQPAMMKELQKALMDKIGSDYSRAAVADLAEAKLRPIYERKGFIRVQFKGPSVLAIASASSAKVEVTFSIIEGSQYSLGTLHMKGDDPISLKAAAKLESLKPGQIANMEDLKSVYASMTSDYVAQGYIDAKVRAVPVFDDTAHTVSYELELVPGEIYHLGKINVEGLNDAEIAEVQSVWALHSGDTYDPAYAPSFLNKNGSKLRFLNGASMAWTQKVSENTRQVDLVLFFRKPSGSHGE